jgi:polysaccharide export outer membrane protein
MAAQLARAQGYGESASSEVPADALIEETEPFADVTLTYTKPPVEEYSTKSTGGIPDFIMESSYYTLGIEDVIDVEVLRHPEVSGQYIINNEGKIQYEFIGDIKVEGMKKDDVKKLLTSLLQEYIISPIVTVKISGYNSKIVYVIGEVGRPGKIFMKGDTITVREALVQAGLPMLSAKASKSHLITPSDSGHPKDIIVNVHKLLYEGDLRENLIMTPGDTLYIPPTFLAKTMRVIQPVTQPINEVGGTAYGF